jgi:nitrate/nitrite-specific signal transduction histidine kinase
MEVQDSVTIKPKIHDLSAFKQIMESRSHPLDMVREALSNMMAPEVGADTISVQHFSHPEYNASFIFKDDGVGMSYTGSDATSRMASLKARTREMPTQKGRLAREEIGSPTVSPRF